MDERPFRKQAKETAQRAQAVQRLPKVDVTPSRQLTAGVLFLVLGAGIALFLPVLIPRVAVVVGAAAGIVFYLAVRHPFQRTGVFSVGMVVLDRDAAVRVFSGLPAITRATRRFTNKRHLVREALLGLAVVAAAGGVGIVMGLAGVGIAIAPLLCAILGMLLVETGVNFIRLARNRQKTGSTMLSGMPMVVLLAAYLHVGGSVDEIKARLPAEVLLRRFDESDEHTRSTAIDYLTKWRMMQAAATSSSVHGGFSS